MSAAETARLTADVVLLAEHEGALNVLLIRRGHDPFAGRWALPGGHVDKGEDTLVAAWRELAEETGIRVDVLRRVGVYAAPGRDPRGRYVTFAYTATLDAFVTPTAGDDATEARWWPVSEIAGVMAFDHDLILADALAERQYAGTTVVRRAGSEVQR